MSPEFFNDAFSEKVDVIVQEQFAAKVKVDITVVASISEVANIVCEKLMVDSKELYKTKRSTTAITIAKQLICWISKVLCNHQRSEIARYFNLSVWTVQSHCNRASSFIEINDERFTNALKLCLKKLLYEA